MHIITTEYVTQTLNVGTTPLVLNLAFVSIRLVCCMLGVSDPTRKLLTSPVVGQEEMRNYELNMGGNSVSFRIQNRYLPITFNRLPQEQPRICPSAVNKLRFHRIGQ